MEFMHSPPDVIRSGLQRRLLDYWNGLRGRASVPAWPGIAITELRPFSADLVCTQVVPVEGNLRFLIRFIGLRVVELHGLEDHTDRYLDEFLPPAYREGALATYRHAVATRLPVYTVADTRDLGGHIVHLERLLLPFGKPSGEVDQVAALLETASPEGAFEAHNLVGSPGRTPAFALCTTIGA